MRKQPVPEIVEAFHRTTEVLREIRDFCTAHDVPLLIASFPRSYQIFQEEFFERLKQTDEARDDFSPDIMSETIASTCNELGVKHLAVDPKFEQARDAGAQRNELFIVNDGHWNQQGHKLAAEAILPELERVVRSGQ